MKKIIIFILIALFSVSIVGFKNRVAVASDNIDVELSSNYIGSSPQYTITFYPETDLSEGTEISIAFDDAIPIRRLDDAKDRISVNGVYLTEDPQFSGHIIKFSLPVELSKEKEATIVIEKGIIINPQDAGYFQIHIKYKDTDLTSNYYHITNVSRIKNPKIKLLEDEVEIELSLGQNGDLEGYTSQAFGRGRFTFVKPVPKDFIFIRFSHFLSDSFTNISRSDIKVNGTYPPISPSITTHFEDTKDEEKEIAIVVPKDINAGSNVKIVIKGINLPCAESGDAYVKVWTSKELTPVKSNVISVKSKYYLNTNLVSSPSEPDGKNGFYTSKVKVSFNVDKGELINSYKTYYSKDNKNFELYTKPIELQDGVQDIYFYSVGYASNRTFKEDVKKAEFNIDTTPPIISLESNKETNSPFYELKVKVEDDNLDYATVTVHSIRFVSKDGVFDIPLYLFDNETPFKVYAVDKGGNSKELSGVINLKGD